jgi:hypothetical protein
MQSNGSDPSSWKGRARRAATFVRGKRYALLTACTIASFLIRHFPACANLPICNNVGLLTDFPPNICNLVEGVASIAVIICARPHREANNRAAATVVTFIPTSITVLYAKDLADMMEELALDIGFFLTAPLVGLTICLAFVPNFRGLESGIADDILSKLTR